MSVNTPSLGSPLLSAAERCEDERTTPRRIEEWALALAQSVMAQIPANFRPVPQSAEGWRTSDNALTQDKNESAPSSGGGSSTLVAPASGDADRPGEGGDGARVSLTIDGGDLGELSLVVDRTKAGVRVVIGVADAAAVAAVGPERAALERALSATGLSIDSVKVVTQMSGTVLAPTSKARMADAKDRADTRDESNGSRKRAQRKLSLIG